MTLLHQGLHKQQLRNHLEFSNKDETSSVNWTKCGIIHLQMISTQNHEHLMAWTSVEFAVWPNSRWELVVSIGDWWCLLNVSFEMEYLLWLYREIELFLEFYFIEGRMLFHVFSYLNWILSVCLYFSPLISLIRTSCLLKRNKKNNNIIDYLSIHSWNCSITHSLYKSIFLFN